MNLVLVSALMPERCDYLVIGSGVAGLAFALEASEHGEVILITKRECEESNTRYAQGGVASVLSTEDSFEAHIRDTLEAGRGLCHDLAVEVCVREGPARIQWLLKQGVHFSVKNGSDRPPELDLGREGGHSARRVAHAADMTGREIMRALLSAVRERPNIVVKDNHTAIDLIMLSKFGGPDSCAGAYVLDSSTDQVYLMALIFSTSSGTTWNRSPTRP